MKGLSTKQEQRLEKKKKKITALAQIMRLNDKDRNSSKANIKDRNSSKASINETLITNAVVEQKLFSDETKQIFERGPKFKKIKLIDSEDSNKNITFEKENFKDITTETIKEISAETIKEFKLSTTKDDDNKKSESYFESFTNIRNISDDSFSKTTDQEDNTDALLTTDDYNHLKKELLIRKRSTRNLPKFRLRELGECAKLSVPDELRTPIFLTDIEHLLMTALIGCDSPCSPSRWCTLEKVHKISNSIVLIVEGLSLFHYFSYQQQFVETNNIFTEQLEILLPPSCNDTKILQEFFKIPLTHSKKDALIEKYGSLECAIDMHKDPILMIKPVFSIIDENNYQLNNLKGNRFDTFPRTKLLLSALQMVDEGYPLPLRGELQNKYKAYKFTKQQYAKVHDKSPLFGVDCEMCKTSLGVNELTRISVVNENYETVYETLVRPSNRIVDYLTKYSGITADIMLNVTKTLQEVQAEVSNLLPADAILVGQSLNSDLHAMQMMHPYIIDTSVIFNITGDRRRKSKLQVLAKTFLGEIIQDKVNGHDPVEDSLASMKLTKLKLSKGLDFGDAILEGRKQQNEIKKQKTCDTSLQNLFSCATKNDKITAIITGFELSPNIRNKIDGDSQFNCGDNQQNEQQNVIKNSIKYFQMDGNKSAINKAREISSESSLTICNLNVAPQQLELSRIEKTIFSIDKSISKLYESAASNSLIVVLFGGTPGTTSGVTMVKIKKTP